MKLYMHPASATSRPISLFARGEDIPLDEITVDLMTGAHMQPDYLALNPNGLVPLLDDEGFRLTESSAILKYLAEKAGSSQYPNSLRDRARVNEMMDLINANLYRDLGFNLVYPALFPHHARRSEEGTAAAIEWGKARSAHWLTILDQKLIGPDHSHLCLNRLTIADHLASGMVGLVEISDLTLEDYPNVARWLSGMKALPHWDEVNGAFYAMFTAPADGGGADAGDQNRALETQN